MYKPLTTFLVAAALLGIVIGLYQEGNQYNASAPGHGHTGMRSGTATPVTRRGAPPMHGNHLALPTGVAANNGSARVGTASTAADGGPSTIHASRRQDAVGGHVIDMAYPCGLTTPAFCDNFTERASGQGSRDGALDPAKWNYTRFSSGINPGQHLVDAFYATDAQHCKTLIHNVLPNRDSFFCGLEVPEPQHWMEAFNDGGGTFVSDAMIRQPFDFTGRTGTIQFGVDAKSDASHTWWVEVLITDQPVVSPHLGPTLDMPPHDGLRIQFSGGDSCPGVGGITPNDLAGLGYNYIASGQVMRFDNYTPTGLDNRLPPSRTTCFKTAPDTTNMVRIKVSTTNLDVYVSDAGTNILRHVFSALLSPALPFSVGYVHFEHAQYNASKEGSGNMQTYHWHDMGFDGPIRAPLRAYDLPDAMTRSTNDYYVNGRPVTGPAMQLGYLLTPTGLTDANGRAIAPFILSQVDLTDATGATLNIGMWDTDTSTELEYRINSGAWHSYANPDGQPGYSWHTLHIPLDLASLKQGRNTVALRSSNASPTAVAEGDLSLSFRDHPRPAPAAPMIPCSLMQLMMVAMPHMTMISDPCDGKPAAPVAPTPPTTTTIRFTAPAVPRIRIARIATNTSVRRRQSAKPTPRPPRLAPDISAGQWVNISPITVSTDFNTPPNNYGFQALAIDPQHPQTLYVGTCYQGLWKTTDGGTSWAKVNTGINGAALDTGRLWSVAVDHFNPKIVYVANGFGSLQGVLKSIDGGKNWTQVLPQRLVHGLSADVYDITTDPYRADHVLVAFHGGWGGGPDAGILESVDGGDTWTVRSPRSGWGSGDYIFFLDNSSTWLLATQWDGFWRTTNGGVNWTQVSTHNMQHGADELYRASNGAYYVGAANTLLRSTDNGASWTPVGPSTRDGYNAVIGDGTTLYAQPANTGSNSTGPNHYYTSSESDGTSWHVYNSQTFSDGPMSMAYDPLNHIVYSSNWRAGVWRLQLPKG